MIDLVNMEKARDPDSFIKGFKVLAVQRNQPKSPLLSSIIAAIREALTIKTVIIHYSGHGVPDINPLQAGALQCADQDLHCWELLQAISRSCPQVYAV